MKKKITSIIIAITMCMTCAFAVPAVTHGDDVYAMAKTTYVKVKKATYNKMKKTIASQKKTIASQKKTIASQKTKISNQEQTIKDKKSTISWLWGTLEDFGYEYNYDTHRWEGTAEPTPIEELNMEDASDVIQLLEEQTGLSIDVVQIMDNWRTWYCYYVQADGDLYVITVKNKVVDVCAILN